MDAAVDNHAPVLTHKRYRSTEKKNLSSAEGLLAGKQRRLSILKSLSCNYFPTIYWTTMSYFLASSLQNVNVAFKFMKQKVRVGQEGVMVAGRQALWACTALQQLQAHQQQPAACTGWQSEQGPGRLSSIEANLLMLHPGSLGAPWLKQGSERHWFTVPGEPTSLLQSASGVDRASREAR